MIDAKLMLPHEVERLQAVQQRTPHEYTWMPILWACKLIQRARTEKKITLEPPVYANLISSLYCFCILISSIRRLYYFSIFISRG